MRRPFRIRDGVVDLEAALVVRSSGITMLSPAEALLLEVLHAQQGQVVPDEALADRLWTLDGRSDRLEPLLWSLRRKLAPAAGILVRTDEGVCLEPVEGSLTRVRRAAALVHHADALDWPADVQVLPVREGSLLLHERARVLVEALSRVPPEQPLRAAVDLLTTVEEAYEPALDAVVARLRRLVDWGPAVRMLITDAASRELSVAIQPVSTWTRLPGGEVETCWALQGELTRGVVAPIPVASTHQPLAGRVDEIATCWAAIEAGAAAVVVHGDAGVGRTTLVEWIAREAPYHLGRSWNVREVPLAGAMHAPDVLRRLANALQVGGDASLEEDVGRVLAALAPVLLVVDDIDEASPEAVAALCTWRARSSRCALLCTSRRPMRLPGALQVALGPLPAAAARRVLHERTRGLAGWDALSPDDPILDLLVSEAGCRPAALVSLAGRALWMAPELLLTALLAERRGDVEPGRGVLRAACARLPTPQRRLLGAMAVLPGSLDLDDVEAVADPAAPPALTGVRHLIEAGLVRAVEDPVLAEVRFVVSRTVREICAPTLSAPDTERARTQHAISLGRRAGAWAEQLSQVGPERVLLRRLALATPVLETVLDLADAPADARLGAFHGLLIQWERGQCGSAWLLERAPTLHVPPEASERHAVNVARLLCDVGRLSEVGQALVPVHADDTPHGLLAQVTRLDVSHQPDRRARLASMAACLLRDVRASMVPILAEVLDTIVVSGLFADAAEVAERYASLAAESGSRWRTAQLGMQAFRARAAMGRQRAQDLRAARRYLQMLSEHGDHRRAAAGIQWLARALTASGDPHSAIALLNRLGGTVDSHGVWAVRHMCRLDDARAHALIGDLEGARARVAEYRILQRQGPQLPGFVEAFDRALLCVAERDGEGLEATLDLTLDTDGGGATHRHLARLLLPLADVLQGRPPRPGPRARGSGQRLLARLVAAWASGEATQLAQAREAVRNAPEWRSIALVGVVLRIADKAAEGALDRLATTE